jgi:putative superfamily III holin-X
MSVEITPSRKDRSLTRVVSDLRSDAGLLIRQEIALAKAQLKEKAATFGVAIFLAYMGVLVLLAALILGVIALGVAAWLATTAVGIVVMLGAVLIVQRARHLHRTSGK